MTINIQRKDDEKWGSKNEKQILFNFLSGEIHWKASATTTTVAHSQNPSADSQIQAGGKLVTLWMGMYIHCKLVTVLSFLEWLLIVIE